MPVTNNNTTRGYVYIPLGLVVIGFIMVKLSPDWPLWTALLFALLSTAVVYYVFYKIRFSEMARGFYQGFKRVVTVILILLIISLLIAIWTKSGVVTAMVEIGLQIIRPGNLLWISFLFTGMLSMFLGSAAGTLSAVGPMLIGIAQVFGSNLGMVAGAAVSGALIGDRSSPISSTVFLLAGMTKTDTRKNVKYITPTLIVSAGITLLLEIFLTFREHVVQSVAPAMDSSLVHVPEWWIVLPVLLFALAVFRIPLYLNFLVSIVVAIVMVKLFGHVTNLSLLRAAWFGTSIVIYKNAVFTAGGVWPTFAELLLVIIASGLSGILEIAGAIDVLLLDIIKVIKNIWNASLITVIFSIFSSGLFASQSMSVILPAQTLGPVFDRLHMKRGELVRLLSDSGVVVSAIIPWNLMAAMLATAVAVPTVHYLPYAFFAYITPVITLIFSVFGSLKQSRLAK